MIGRTVCLAVVTHHDTHPGAVHNRLNAVTTIYRRKLKTSRHEKGGEGGVARGPRGGQQGTGGMGRRRLRVEQQRGLGSEGRGVQNGVVEGVSDPSEQRLLRVRDEATGFGSGVSNSADESFLSDNTPDPGGDHPVECSGGELGHVLMCQGLTR